MQHNDRSGIRPLKVQLGSSLPAQPVAALPIGHRLPGGMRPRLAGHRNLPLERPGGLLGLLGILPQARVAQLLDWVLGGGAQAWPRGRPAVEEDAPFFLGMPHLGADGLSVSWLLRECGHVHWRAVAEITGVEPGQLTDRFGNRAFASVVSCRVEGRPEAFGEEDRVRFVPVLRPAPETGWRSRTALVAESGARIDVELVTLFARRERAGSARLVRAEMDPALLADDTGPKSARARLMRGEARAAHGAAQADAAPAHLSIPISSALHYNAVLLCYYANLSIYFQECEGLVLAQGAQTLPLLRMRIDCFGSLDDEEMLDLVSVPSVAAIAPTPRVVIRSHARRRSDGAVVATCETVRGYEDDEAPV